MSMARASRARVESRVPSHRRADTIRVRSPLEFDHQRPRDPKPIEVFHDRGIRAEDFAAREAAQAKRDRKAAKRLAER